METMMAKNELVEVIKDLSQWMKPKKVVIEHMYKQFQIMQLSWVYIYITFLKKLSYIFFVNHGGNLYADAVPISVQYIWDTFQCAVAEGKHLV